MKKRSGDSEKGVALIAAVLAVVVLLAIGLSFAFNMRLEEKAAVNYMSSLQARYVVEAGIQYTVAKLKNDADPSGSYSYAATEHDQLGDIWDFSSSPIPTGSIDLGKGVIGNYTVTVVDNARRIYLNDFNNPNLGTALENLVDALRTAEATDLEDGDGTSIYSNRPTQANGGYITEKQIMVVSGSTVDATEYSTLKDYVTSEGYFDPNRFGGRSAVNINTADQYTLQAIFESISSTDRDTIVQAILEYRSGKEYDTDPDAILGNNDRWVQNGNDVGDGNTNPFDGIDTNQGDNIDPQVSNFDSDNLDNNGDWDDYLIVNGVYDPGEEIDEPDEERMFAGGARGEFNALIDYLATSIYGNGSGTISSATTVKNNADPTQSPTTVGLDFESKFFEITSTGQVGMDSNSDNVIDEVHAESVIVRIVERER